MKVAIMQPYVFPYIGYFQLINAVDTFVFYDDVNFIKKGFINRNSILLNGKAYQFTIPCKGISQNKRICDVQLGFDRINKEKLIKTIYQAYHNAPYFEALFPLLESFLKNNTKATISEFAIDSLLFICHYLGIDKTWVISSRQHQESNHLSAQDRILTIAKKEKATVYLNPAGGRNLYSKPHFKDEGLILQFIKSKPILYPQFHNEFVPWLSILDVVMFNSISDVKHLLNAYTLL